MKKTILKGAAMLLGGVLLGTLLMIAAYAIPSESGQWNVCPLHLIMITM